MAKRPQNESKVQMPVQPILSTESVDALMKGHVRAAQMWLDSWSKLTSELTSFATERWTQNMEMIRSCGACQCPEDLVRLQSAFIERMFGDYIREATKLADIETGTAMAEMEEMHRGFREATKAGVARQAAVATDARP